MMLSPQFTTPPLLVILNVRSRYNSSPDLGLYGFSGRLHTRGLIWSGTGTKVKINIISVILKKWSLLTVNHNIIILRLKN
jgi:hypothetical protein